MCGCLSHAPPLGTCPATQACAPTGNQTCNPLVRSLCSIHQAQQPGLTTKDLKSHIPPDGQEGWRHGDRAERPCGRDKQWWQRNTWSCIHVWWIKIGKGIPGPSDPSPDQMHSPGFQHQGDRPPLTLAAKTSGYWGGRKNYHFHCLMGPHGLRTYANPRAAAKGVLMAYGKWVD